MECLNVAMIGTTGNPKWGSWTASLRQTVQIWLESIWLGRKGRISELYEKF